MIPGTPWRLETMSVPSLMDKRGWRRIMAVGKVLRMILEARKFLKREKPDLVVGMGGYSSGPMVLMAGLMGIPTVIHEQNAQPGMTNRLLTPFAKKIFTAFSETERNFPKKKTQVIGTPVRKSLLQEARAVEREERFVVLILGGSQGSQFLNECLLGSLPALSEKKDQLHIVHQVGASADAPAIEKQYRTAGFDAEVHPFIHNMGFHYGRARLVIARAGATTIAELQAVGRPALFVPYPHSAQGHQIKNAESMVRLGVARMCEQKDLSPEKMAEEILWALQNREALAEMENKYRNIVQTPASQVMATECLRMVKGV